MKANLVFDTFRFYKGTISRILGLLLALAWFTGLYSWTYLRAVQRGVPSRAALLVVSLCVLCCAPYIALLAHRLVKLWRRERDAVAATQGNVRWFVVEEMPIPDPNGPGCIWIEHERFGPFAAENHAERRAKRIRRGYMGSVLRWRVVNEEFEPCG